MAPTNDIPSDPSSSPTNTRTTTTANNLTLRPWEAADIPSLVAVALAALPQDPQWPWRYPGHATHPEAAAAFLTQRFTNELENVKRGSVSGLLVELPLDAAPPPSTTTPSSPHPPVPPNAHANLTIGLATFHLPHSHISPPPSLYQPSTPPSPPPGASPSRMAAFAAQLGAATRATLLAAYGERQLQLDLLYVHPAHQGRGAGGVLLRWGEQRAREERVVVSLWASPMGERVYAGRGFGRVGSVRVRDDGGGEGEDEGREDLVPYPAMVWVPEELRGEEWTRGVRGEGEVGGEGEGKGEEEVMPRGKQVCTRR